MSTSYRGGGRGRPLAFITLLGGSTLIGLSAWIGPQLAAWVNTGRWPALGFWRAQGALVRLIAGTRPSRPPATRPRSGTSRRPPRFWTVLALLASRRVRR